MYSFNLNNQQGQASSYTFLSLFNPVGSGKTVLLHHCQAIPYAASTSTSVAVQQLFRITAASGGTLQSASAINKMNTASADTAAEVRTGNPTVTLGPSITSFAPPTQSLTITAYAPAMQELKFLADQWGNFVLAEGEGVAYLQGAAGDVDQRLNFTIVWSE